MASGEKIQGKERANKKGSGGDATRERLSWYNCAVQGGVGNLTRRRAKGGGEGVVCGTHEGVQTFPRGRPKKSGKRKKRREGKGIISRGNTRLS